MFTPKCTSTQHSVIAIVDLDSDMPPFALDYLVVCKIAGQYSGGLLLQLVHSFTYAVMVYWEGSREKYSPLPLGNYLQSSIDNCNSKCRSKMFVMYKQKECEAQFVYLKVYIRCQNNCVLRCSVC